MLRWNLFISLSLFATVGLKAQVMEEVSDGKNKKKALSQPIIMNLPMTDRFEINFPRMTVPENIHKWDAPVFPKVNYLTLIESDKRFEMTQLKENLQRSLQHPLGKIKVTYAPVQANLVQIPVMNVVNNRRDLTGRVLSTQAGEGAY